MILKVLLNIQLIWLIFVKALKIIIQLKKWKILIVFDDVIAGMLSNKKLYAIGTELFIRGRKPNISLVFIIQSSFAVPKDMRPNSRHHFITE